jgi:phage terminase large subunit GpA-like protein
MSNAPFANVHDVTAGTSELIRPSSRLKPSAAAAAYLSNDKGAWDATLAPMMCEPLDLLASREYTGIVYVGPARTSKTFTLVFGAVTWIVTCSPGDTLITQMSNDTARDFSRTEVDRVIRHSPELAARLSPRAKDDNTFDKFFRSGMMLKLGWPAVSQLSSKTLKYVLLTDYDRPLNRDNVDGEGPMWDLAAKRIETYMSRGKCVAESSPGTEYLDAQWRPSTPHEAPPAPGILSLYNRGTRARQYWPCQHCGEYFQAKPGIDAFAIPTFEELEKLVIGRNLTDLATEFCKVPCSHCGALHDQSQKRLLNALGVWVHEGETINADGTKSGQRRQSNISSYWQGGVSATYQSWPAMVFKYLQAVHTYARTRDEQPLKACTNTDLAAPYLPRVVARRRSSHDLIERLEDWPRGTVPDGVRFLTAAVDVQANKFAIHVFGWGVGLESWLIDRFFITSSKRPEEDRTAALEPGSYSEDWELLIPSVIERTYQSEKTDERIPIRMVLCDSGGKAGVSARAYAFYRYLKKIGKRKSFFLVKGASRVDAPTSHLSWPDTSDRKDRKQGSRGDVPVWILNTNVLKDAVVGDLSRTEVGPGYVHLPRWLGDDEGFFAELEAEHRTDKGWKRSANASNEALDLHVYNRAACKVLKADRINWANPPLWARAITADQSNASPVAMTPQPNKPRITPTVPKQRRATSTWLQRSQGSWFKR